jgi:hypothetical protein
MTCQEFKKFVNYHKTNFGGFPIYFSGDLKHHGHKISSIELYNYNIYNLRNYVAILGNTAHNFVEVVPNTITGSHKAQYKKAVLDYKLKNCYHLEVALFYLLEALYQKNKDVKLSFDNKEFIDVNTLRNYCYLYIVEDYHTHLFMRDDYPKKSLINKIESCKLKSLLNHKAFFDYCKATIAKWSDKELEKQFTLKKSSVFLFKSYYEIINNGYYSRYIDSYCKHQINQLVQEEVNNRFIQREIDKRLSKQDEDSIFVDKLYVVVITRVRGNPIEPYSFKLLSDNNCYLYENVDIQLECPKTLEKVVYSGEYKHLRLAFDEDFDGYTQELEMWFNIDSRQFFVKNI